MNDLERDHRDDSVEGVLDKAARTALAKQAMEIEFKPIDTDIALKKQKATRIPFEGVAALGVGLLPMGDSLRTVTQAVTIPNNGLLQAFDKFGNLVDIQTLSRFNDGTGMMGSRIHPVNGFEQIRFQEAGSQVVDVATQLPYDPTTLLVAAALMEINKKLDAIQETQQEMFEYIRQKDKAALRATLRRLRVSWTITPSIGTTRRTRRTSIYRCKRLGSRQSRPSSSIECRSWDIWRRRDSSISTRTSTSEWRSSSMG